MAMFGTYCLMASFVAALMSCMGCLVACVRRVKEGVESTGLFAWLGRVGALIAFVGLFCCCALLVFCFISGDNSIEYVVQYRSNSVDSFAWLYILSGLWAGRQGSLLFWAALIAAFAVFVVVRNRKHHSSLDDAALIIVMLVLVAFTAVLLFSPDNMPFKALSSIYLAADGSLTNGAELWSLNALLEHWAMAVHPSALFIGYAGLTIPFAYALAALLIGDDSDAWVLRVNGIASFAWLFLGIGIGLGSVWAYVVLGWGGYWGWDPVENASLLSWLMCVALLHSFTLYRKRAQFKRWSVVCACLAFMFVIVGTFISRSGLVQSVHAFSGDPVSSALFAMLIGVSFAAAVSAIFVRPKSFALRCDSGEKGKEGKESEGRLFSQEMAYYLNNVIMVLASFLLMYLTVSSALPSWMPFGGDSVAPATYNTIARPVSVFIVLMMSLCPLLSWKGGNIKDLGKQKIPLIGALILFVLLMIYFVARLVPAYHVVISTGGSTAEELLLAGPTPYYYGLTIVAFAGASLLFSNAFYTVVRMLRGLRDSLSSLRAKAGALGGFIAHCSLAIIMVGLVGSSMYTVERTGYVAGTQDSSFSSEFEIMDYRLVPVGETTIEKAGDSAVFTQAFDVYRNQELLYQVSPAITVDGATMQQQLDAEVVSMPDHDLFVVFQGLNALGDYSLDVRVNPLIGLVWLGFALLMIGTTIGALARRKPYCNEHNVNKSSPVTSVTV